MSALKIIKGDLIELAKQGEFNMIFQGCNCFCTMNSGIAKQIREEFPTVYAADVSGGGVFGVGDERKLGNWTAELVNTENGSFGVYNLYTQYAYGSDKRHFEYAAFEIILRKFELMLEHQKVKRSLGFPLIGCGLAGGDASVVKAMLHKFANVVAKYGHTVTLVEYEG